MFKGLSLIDNIFKNSQTISLSEGDKYKLNSISLDITKLNDNNQENENKINEEIQYKMKKNKMKRNKMQI